MVDEFLANLVVGEEQTYGHLTIAPLISIKPTKMKLKTLQEGLADGTLEVTEVDSDGDLPFLKFINRNDESVLILESEIVKGNRQDRTVRYSFIIYGHSEVIGDVFCCQAGRWQSAKTQKGFKPNRNISPSIRKSFSNTTQSKVWEQIREKSRRMNVESATSAADDIYQQYQHQIEEYRRAFNLRA